MQNKQLERQLRSIIQSLKASEITKVVDTLEQQQAIFLNKNFSKSGINCTCCTLAHDKLLATGFGRNQQQALINATKNYLQTLVSNNSMIPQLKNALKLREKQTEPPLPVTHQVPNQDDTLDLEGNRDIGDMSVIEEGGCKCIYYEVHQHHMNEIKNLEARMKLIVKENQMLKQLLLRDGKGEGNEKSWGDKENNHFRANCKL